MNISNKRLLEGVKAKAFSNSGNNWQEVEIFEGTDEGRSLIAISTHFSFSDDTKNSNPVELTFNAEDLPVLIAYLIKANESLQRKVFDTQIKWKLYELNEKKG